MLRIGSIDMIGYWILWRSKKRAVSNRVSGTAFRKYSAMVLINGLALGLSKSKLQTPHRQINNIKKLDFHHRWTLNENSQSEVKQSFYFPASHSHEKSLETAAWLFQLLCTDLQHIAVCSSSKAELSHCTLAHSPSLSHVLVKCLTYFSCIVLRLSHVVG